jgi:membrane-bound ClpP family serine protease
LILFTPVFALPLFWFFPLNTALPIYISILVISGFLYFKVFQAMRSEVLTGQEAMLGKEGLVVEDIAPEGKVQYASETWDAMTKGKRFVKGEKVKISGFQGMRLLVEERPPEKYTLGKRSCCP